MEWRKDLPEKSGFYIVKTKSSGDIPDFFKNEKTVEANYNAETKRWTFTNQIFVKYLKEDTNE